MAQRFEQRESFYSHGWLVPFATGWLIWRVRVRLPQGDARPEYWGMSLLVPSLLVHVIATWWHVHVVSGLAMVASVYGLVWTLWGRSVLRVVRLPLLFLFFMVPLPGVLLLAISFKMKLLAAAMAANVIGLFSIPAVQEGSVIRVPGLSVTIDDTCSGLRSLISLIALSVLWLACLPSSSRWQKAAIVAASVPIALVANAVRIVVVVLLSAIYGPQVAESFVQDGSGLVMFAVALGALVWVSRCLAPGPRPLAHGEALP
jgi:exosortase